MAMPGVRVYVIHARPLRDVRESSIKHVLSGLRGGAERISWITKHDPDELLAMPSLTECTDFTPVAGVFGTMLRQMHVNQLSNAMKHAEALRRIAEFPTEGDDDPLHLVLEDDCVLAEDAGEPADVLRNMVQLAATRRNWGAFFPCVAVPGDGEVQDVSKQGTPFMPATVNAYFVTPQFAKRMQPWFQRIKFAWHIQLAYCMHMAQSDAPVPVMATRSMALLDGSKTGHFMSTLAGENALSLCPDFIELVKLVTKGAASRKQVDAVLASFRARPGVLQDHPDMLRVYADFLHRHQQHVAAHGTLAQACAVLLANPLVLVNNKSRTMRQYLASFAHVQDMQCGDQSVPSCKTTR